MGTAGWMLIGVLVMPAPGGAADIFVNTTVDTNDGLCIQPFGCSLRDAVMIANSNAGLDTIHLPAGNYNLTILGGGGAERGDLNITDDVDIRGAGANVTLINGPSDQILFDLHDEVDDGHPLLQLFDLTFGGAVAGRNAAIYVWRCIGTGGPPLPAVLGGNFSTILVVDTVIRGNVSPSNGGAINVYQSDLIVSRSTLAENLALNVGGAIKCDDSSVWFSNVTLTGNRLSPGHSSGGFFGHNCDVLITGSTLAGNITNDLELDPSSPGAVTIRNTYIGSACPLGTANAVTSEGGNVGSPDCGLNHPSDIDFVGGTAILLPLGYYGGYTPTMPPFGVGYHELVDNPGADAHCLADDQRGISRPQDGGSGTVHCDTGAVERTLADLAFIFADDFESGDTSVWSSTVP